MPDPTETDPIEPAPEGERASQAVPPESPSLEASSQETLAPEEQEYRAAIGFNADYYLHSWGMLADTEARRSQFNWGAFILSGIWLPWRKMYRITLLYFFVVALWATLEELVLVRLWAMEVEGWFFSLIRLTAPAICGLYANRWYLNHIRNLVRTARAEEPELEARLELLHERGGASVITSISMVLLYIFAAMTVLMTIELFVPAKG